MANGAAHLPVSELLDSTLILYDVLIVKNILDQGRQREKLILTIV